MLKDQVGALISAYEGKLPQEDIDLLNGAMSAASEAQDNYHSSGLTACAEALDDVRKALADAGQDSQGINAISSDIPPEDIVGVTEPAYDVGSPEMKLNNLIHAAEKLDAMSPEERDEFMGQFRELNDKEVLELIARLITPGEHLASVSPPGY